MKKMIPALLAASITFTGLSFTAPLAKPVYAEESCMISETITVLTAEEAAEINLMHDIAAEAGGGKLKKSDLLSAGDYKINVTASCEQIYSLFLRWSDYDASAVAPLYDIQTGTSMEYVCSDDSEIKGLSCGFINEKDSMISFGIMNMNTSKKQENKSFGTIYLKALKPYNGNNDIFPTLSVAECKYAEKGQIAGDLTDQVVIGERRIIVPEDYQPKPVFCDTDGDGTVTMADAVLVLRCLEDPDFSPENSDKTSEELFQLCDLNGDGRVDFLDTCVILGELAKQA